MMRRLIWAAVATALALLAGIMPGPGMAAAGEYVAAPQSLESMANPRFRLAMRNYAPDYDRLSRDRQVSAFVQVYKSLNKGQMPALPPADYNEYVYDELRTTERMGQEPAAAVAETAAPPASPAGDDGYTWFFGVPLAGPGLPLGLTTATDVPSYERHIYVPHYGYKRLPPAYQPVFPGPGMTGAYGLPDYGGGPYGGAPYPGASGGSVPYTATGEAYEGGATGMASPPAGGYDVTAPTPRRAPETNLNPRRAPVPDLVQEHVVQSHVDQVHAGPY